METQECHDVSLKELPTRELKLRRNKDRRDSPTIPPIRLRLKSNTSPLHETDLEKSMSDRSISSSPDSVCLNLSPTSAFCSYNKYSQGIDLFTSSPNVIVEANNNVPCEAMYPAQTYMKGTVSTDCDTDYDQPLDMSTKRSQETVTSSDVHSFHYQQQRPSVITCASALLRTQCNLTDLAHHMCTTAVTDSNSVDADEMYASISDHTDNSERRKSLEDVRPGHRREIVSGSCDPVIDEHFRRSLGKDYQQVFSKTSPNSVSITVDDHFAKALGDTWLQLQQSKATNPDSSPPSQSPKSIHSQQPSQFLKHSPEIVST